MKSRRALQVAIIVCALLAYLSFALMDTVPDYSGPQDIMQAAGYLLCGLTLYFVYKMLTNRTA